MAEEQSSGSAAESGDGVRVVLCTCPERESLRIAHALIRSGCAACVNVLPRVTSVYLWEGEVREEKEDLLIIKTMASAVEALRKTIVGLHPYTVPEVLSLQVMGGESHREYVDWVADCCLARD